MIEVPKTLYYEDLSFQFLSTIQLKARKQAKRLSSINE